MRAREVTRVRPTRAVGFTLVEILLALLILSVGLLGVLALFPLGIDAARVSVETTRAASIARMAKAYLFEVNGSGADTYSPFQRIVNAVDAGATGPWYLPAFDEFLNPDSTDGGDADSDEDGPEVQPVAAAVEDPLLAEYSWSMTVAYPSSDADADDVPDYALLGEEEEILIVQVTVYRKFGVARATGDVAQDSMVIEGIGPGNVIESIRSGDYVRNLEYDLGDDPCAEGDGFWYQVDQVDEASDRVKLTERFWGLEDTSVDLEFSDRVVGTYTFLLSAN